MRRAAHPWDRFYRDQPAPWRGERDLTPLRPYLRGRILELGCGNGKTLRPLRRAGFDVLGLDVSWHAVRRVEQGVLGDAAALPVAAACFDTVLDLHCSGHLEDDARRACLADVCRVLRPGGHVAIERQGLQDVRSEGATSRRLADGRVTYFFDEAGLRAEAEAAGLDVVESSTVGRQTTWRGRRVMRENVFVVASRRVL